VTVTDANLALNRLSPDAPLGSGHIPLDQTLAVTALTQLARRVGLDALALADGVVRIAVARMVSAIKQISIANGHDPRDFVLLAYGGAGPMHAAAIADELEISRILVPLGPGNFAAFGALISDIRLDYARTRTMQLDDRAVGEIAATFSDMEQEARDNLRAEGVADTQAEISRALGMRYLGQSWELVVDLPDTLDDAGAGAGPGWSERLIALFAEVHDRRFGHRSGGAVEIVSFRLAAVGRLAKPRLPPLPTAAARSTPPVAKRQVYFGTRFEECAVHARESLRLDEVVAGPAVIEESGSTTIIPPGWMARTIGHGELLMERLDHE
jgi:N-methylhydantoinase A